MKDEREKHADGSENSDLSNSSDNQKASLERMRLEILTVEKTVAEASYFLPPYDARACTAAVEKLKSDVAEVLALLAPRKKFSFKSKRKTKQEGDGDVKGAAGDTNSVSGDATSSGNNDDNTSTVPADLLAKVAALQSAADASGYTDAVGKTFVFRNDMECEGANNTHTLPDLVLERLTDCTIFILGSVRAMRCHDLERCKIFGGPVSGSAFFQKLQKCHVEISARQVRVHDAYDTGFYIRTLSRPIIEHSSDVHFAPFTFAYDGQIDNLKTAGLHEETNAWQNVDDFGWIKKQHSPNWSVVAEGGRVTAPVAPGLDVESDLL